MKIREINEDLRGAIYKATGGTLGGIKGQQSALKTNYIDRFNNQLKLAIQAAKAGGNRNFDMKRFLDSYTDQYGWSLNPQEQAQIDQLSKNASLTGYSNQTLAKISNYMYSLAVQNQGTKPGDRRMYDQPRPATKSNTPKPTSGGNVSPPAPGPTPGPALAPAPTQQQTAKQQAGEPISPTAEKIMAAIGSLKGPTTSEDLDSILRDAAYLLSRIDKPRYQNTLRDLTAGVSGTSAAGTKPSQPPPAAGTKPAAPQSATTRPAAPQSATAQSTNPKARMYKDVEQALPGYSKAADDLEQKMTGKPLPPGTVRAYRPGTAPTGGITDVVPKMKRGK